MLWLISKNNEDKGGDTIPPSDPALKSDRCVVPAGVVSHLMGAKVSGRNPHERPDFYSTFLKELVIPVLIPVPHREYKSSSDGNGQKETYKKP